MINISFLQTLLHLLINRFLVKNIQHLSHDIDSKVSLEGSKKEKAVQPKRIKKKNRLNLLHLLFFIEKVHNLMIFC